MNNTITRIQLVPTAPEFISGYLDVDQRVPVPINYAISDIRDPQKRTGSFSKTITIPGTKNNNKLLSQLFEINVAEGPFSVKKLYRCILLQDGIPLHENELSLQLISVNKIQNQLNEDDIVEYNVVVRDDVAQFFTEVSNKKLTDIDFTDLTHNINPGTIISSFTNTWVDGYKYLLPFKEKSNFYDFYEAVPSIYVKTYWDRLHADAGFQYEFFNNIEPEYFDKLIIPTNRDVSDQTISAINNNKVLAARPNNQQKIMNSVFDPGIGLYQVSGGNYPPNFTFLDNLFHNMPPIQDISGSLVSSLQWDPQLTTSTNNFKVSVEFDYEYVLVNPNLFPLNIFNFNLGPGPVNRIIETSFLMLLGGGPGAPQFSNAASFTSVDILVAPDTYTVPSIGVFSLFSGKYSGEIVLSQTQIGQNWFPVFISRPLLTFQESNPFSLEVRITNYSLKIELDTNTLISNQPIDMNETVPQDMTQSDFLRSIYTMYNLYVVPDKFDSNKLIYYKRDDFYRNGSVKDWTNKMDRSSEQILEFLPELRNKELLLTYKEDDDVVNDFYTSFTKEIYGQKNIKFNIEWTKGIDKKEIEFSPTPGNVSLFNHYLPYIERKGNPRILIDNGIKSTPTIPVNIVSSYTTAGNPIFTPSIFYPFASHFNETRNPTFDINFGDNPYYFYDIGVSTLNNLYNNFWRNTIQLIDKGKMLTAYFYLTPTDIYDLELNDVIRIDNSYWNINKIIDYDAGDRRLTKVELITSSELLAPTIDDEEEPEPFEFDPDAEAYMIALEIPNDDTLLYEATDQEITGAQIWMAVNNAVISAKSEGIYGIGWQDANLATSLIEGWYPAIGGDASRHSKNLADLSNPLTFAGSWTHNQFGFTGNGVNAFARTNIIPNGNPRIGGSNMVLGIYSRTSQAPNNCGPCRSYMGARNSSFGQATVWYARSNQFNVIVNNNGSIPNPTGMTDIKGFNSVKRAGGTYTNYVEGLPISTNSETSTNPTTFELYLGALNQSNTAFEYVNINWIGAFIADTMTDSQMLAFRNLVNILNGVLNRLPV